MDASTGRFVWSRFLYALAATLTAWRLGDSEVLWQQTFPLAAGERLSWRLVHGALVEESHGVVRLFAPAEER